MKKFRCKFCKNKKINFLGYRSSGEIIKYCKKCNVKYYLTFNSKNSGKLLDLQYYIDVDDISYIIYYFVSHYMKSSCISIKNKHGYICHYPYSDYMNYNGIPAFNIFADGKYHPDDVKKSLIKILKLINLS